MSEDAESKPRPRLPERDAEILAAGSKLKFVLNEQGELEIRGNRLGLRALAAGLDSEYYVTDWSPDGGSVYVASSGARQTTVKVLKVNVVTGKMEPWRTFGSATNTGIQSVAAPHLSADGDAYAYVYDRDLSEAYVVTGLK
jgi:Tol biopolymer transport system component